MIKLKIIRNDKSDYLESDFNLFIKENNPHIVSIKTHMTDDTQRSYHYILIYYYTQEQLRSKKLSHLLHKEIKFGD